MSESEESQDRTRATLQTLRSILDAHDESAEEEREVLLDLMARVRDGKAMSDAVYQVPEDCEAAINDAVEGASTELWGEETHWRVVPSWLLRLLLIRNATVSEMSWVIEECGRIGASSSDALHAVCGVLVRNGTLLKQEGSPTGHFERSAIHEVMNFVDEVAKRGISKSEQEEWRAAAVEESLTQARLALDDFGGKDQA